MKKIALITFAIFAISIPVKIFLLDRAKPTEESRLIPIAKKVPSLPQVTPKLSKVPTPPAKELRKRVFRKKSDDLIETEIPSYLKPRVGRSEEEARQFSFQDEEGNIVITTITVAPEGHLVAHGDIIVGSTADIKIIQNGEKLIKIMKPQTWENNTVPYVLDTNFTQSQEVEIGEAMAKIQQRTNVKFVKRTEQKDYIQFRKGISNCYSSLGRIGGVQFVSLSEGCNSGEITHELVHALGFLHEQNRPDRDQHIRILWENIAEEHWPQFKKIESGFYDIEKHEFDFESIMLYPPDTFSQYPGDYTIVKTNGDPYPGNREYLSSGDIEKINDLYPKIIKE